LIEQCIYAQQGDPANFQALLETIRSYQGQAVDPNYYYQQITQALIADLPLDMEIFIRGTGAALQNTLVTTENRQSTELL
ncbi:hypothetical protein NE578_10350, partial [Schaalia odontolytica]|uniref:hypothetical protein n=1 Tax=Schaalia odontolytica TaxID=1660 RepID=UPI00210B7862